MDDKVAAAILTQAFFAAVQSDNPQAFGTLRAQAAPPDASLPDASMKVVENYYRKMLEVVRRVK